MLQAKGVRTTRFLQTYLNVQYCDKFTLTLFMAIADRERELISIRTTGALIQKVERSGQWRKGSQAFTTGRAARSGHATIVDQTARNGHSRPASAMIKQLREQDYNWSEIARQLNTGGFKTPKGGNFRLYKCSDSINE